MLKRFDIYLLAKIAAFYKHLKINIRGGSGWGTARDCVESPLLDPAPSRTSARLMEADYLLTDACIKLRLKTCSSTYRQILQYLGGRSRRDYCADLAVHLSGC